MKKNSEFDSRLILSQIVFTVTLYYFFLISFSFLFNNIFGLRAHIDQILSSDIFSFDGKYGVVALLSHFFTNTIMISVYIFSIEKANKILDYVLTSFLINLIFTSINNKFPFSLTWWLFNIMFFGLVTVISEFICLKIEQREISIGFANINEANI